jgi:hypothetical protein
VISARTVYRPQTDATAHQELEALTAVYRFILFDSEASKGGPHDLTNNGITETVKNGPRKTEQENI